MSETIPATVPRRLVGWGEVEWSRLADAAGELTCAWADYDGFHIGSCPPESPPYSHIWGWSADGSVLMRGRIDAGKVTVGWLYEQSRDEGDEVACVTRDLITWEPDHQKLKVRFVSEQAFWPSRMRTVEVLGSQPVAFIQG